jgi:hypothetical protein
MSSSLLAPPPMTNRADAQAPALSISKICDAQREFDASVRALSDFFSRKKRGSSGMLLTPTRSLHEKGLVSARQLQKPAVCDRLSLHFSADCRLHFNNSGPAVTALALQRARPPPPVRGLPKKVPPMSPIYSHNRALPYASHHPTCRAGPLTPPWRACACHPCLSPPQLLPPSRTR